MYSQLVLFFFFKQKTAYDMRISDWSSDVCSSDLKGRPARGSAAPFYLAFHAFDVASVVAPTPQITQGSASVLSGVGGSRRSRTNSRGSGDGASLPFAVRATAVIANNGLVAGTPSCSISTAAESCAT